jgi:hypothetical protein
MPEAKLKMTPADLIAHQNDLVRTGQCIPLGRMKMIAIGPNAACPPRPTWDTFMQKWGRLIQFRDQELPIAQYAGMILVTAPLVSRDGFVKLPDLPDPTWRSAPWTEEELHGKQMIHPETNKPYSVPVPRPVEKDTPRMLPQDLRARAEGFLEGTNFYVFSPVLSISFQPEENQKMLGTFWAVNCTPNPADGTSPTLLVDAQTGETHFFGGLYEIVRAAGEN